MAVSRNRKSEILAEVETLLKSSSAVSFTSNNKLTVLEISNIRKDLRKVDGAFMIAKKTLIRIAFKNVFNVDLNIDTLPGQVSMIVSKGDKIAPMGVVNKYVQELKKEEKIKFVGAFFDGRVLDAREATRLATLPSREVLLAKLLGSMLSPLSSLARFLDAAKTDLESKGLDTVGKLTVAAVVAAAPAAKEEAPVAEAPAAEAAPEVVAPEAPAATEEAPKAE